MAEEFTPSQVVIYCLEAVVLGAVVVYKYFNGRKDRKREPWVSQFTFENSAAFELAYSVGVEILANPQNEIAPGLFMYFNESQKARVCYQQLVQECHKHDNLLRYVLRIVQHDATDVQWLSLERRLQLSSQEATNRFHCRIKARANQTTKITLVLIPPNQGDVEKRVEIGVLQLTTSFEDFAFSLTPNESTLGLRDSRLWYRFVVFLEVKSGLCVDLKAWDLNIDEIVSL